MRNFITDAETFYTFQRANFRLQDKTWAEFSAIKLAIHLLCLHCSLELKQPNLKLKTRPLQLIGFLPSYYALTGLSKHPLIE